MSVKTVTTRVFRCDHCEDTATYGSDAQAGMEGWSLITVNGGQYALCRIHAGRVQAFLRGDAVKAAF